MLAGIGTERDPIVRLCFGLMRMVWLIRLNSSTGVGLLTWSVIGWRHGSRAPEGLPTAGSSQVLRLSVRFVDKGQELFDLISDEV